MPEILDPRLKYLQEKKKRELEVMDSEGMFGLSVERVDRRIEPSVKVFVQFSGEVDLLRQAGLEVRTVAGDVISGLIHMDDVSKVASVEGVVRIEVSRPLARELDVSLPEINVPAVHNGPPGNRGSGVIIGIIDSGIDITHDAFRQAGGQTRILSIWDQSLSPQAGTGETNPAGFNYGVEYSKADIDNALNSPNPAAIVRHRDSSVSSGHGTHVSGIAAGDGSAAPANTFVGVAPEAQIIMVRNFVTTQAMGDSTQTLDAVDYIFNKANLLDLPVVINLSQGDNIGPHDGTSLLERGIDNLLGAKGNIMVKSAGNEGTTNRHAMGTVPDGGSVNVQLSANTSDIFTNIIDIWYDGQDRFDVSITPPGGVPSAVIAAGGTTSPPITLPNGNELFVDSSLNDVNNNDNRIYVTIGRGTAATVQSGIWTITLTGQTVVDGRFHAWIERSFPDPTFTFRTHRTNSHTISIPGTSSEIIAVGSYITNDTGSGNLSSFSSRGPTRDNRPKPEISAPGQWITSARAQAITAGNPGDNYYPNMGTSMAAPHITGVIALMLHRNPGLTQQQVRDCLMNNARSDAFTGLVPNNNWGAGKVDAQAAVNCVQAQTPLKVIDDLGPGINKTLQDGVLKNPFLDQIQTAFKFVDDPNPGTPFKFFDDPQPATPIKFFDDPNPGTFLKFLDDPNPNPTTQIKVLDDPTSGTNIKAFDDVKHPGRPSTMDKQPWTDGPLSPVRNPPGNVSPEAAPFVMATPHHSTAWMSNLAPEMQQALAAYQAALQQYEAAIIGHKPALDAGTLGERDQAMLASLNQEYQSLLKEYQQVLNTMGLA